MKISRTIKNIKNKVIGYFNNEKPLDIVSFLAGLYSCTSHDSNFNLDSSESYDLLTILTSNYDIKCTLSNKVNIYINLLFVYGDKEFIIGTNSYGYVAFNSATYPHIETKTKYGKRLRIYILEKSFK